MSNYKTATLTVDNKGLRIKVSKDELYVPFTYMAGGFPTLNGVT